MEISDKVLSILEKHFNDPVDESCSYCKATEELLLKLSIEAYMSEVLRLISGGISGDLNKVKQYSLFLADKLEDGGYATLARRIKNIIADNGRNITITLRDNGDGKTC